MLKPLWGKHPDRRRPPISVPEVGLVPFFLTARVGLANFSLSSFIGVLDWFRIPNETPLLIYIFDIYTHTLWYFIDVSIYSDFHLSLVRILLELGRTSIEDPQFKT